MGTKKISVHKLHIRNLLLLATFCGFVSIILFFYTGKLLTPFYHETIYRESLDQFNMEKSRLAVSLLQHEYDKTYNLIRDDNFFPFAKSKSLHQYSLYAYRNYGLLKLCHEKLEKKEWGNICQVEKLLWLEFPVKTADNTLAHLIVSIKPSMSNWTPFATFRRILIFIISAIIVFTTLLVLQFKIKFGKPIRKSLEIVDTIEEPSQLKYLLKNIPIEELHKLTSALVHKQEELHAVQLEVSEYQTKDALLSLATRVAHDIRSPLSSLQAAAGYLGNMKIEDPKASDVINLLELSAKRLTGIADDLLEKHKGDSEEKCRFSVHQVLDELVGEFEGQERYRKVRFVKRYASGAIYMEGDAAKLQRAFGNVIKNGAEAMGFEGIVTLKTELEGKTASVRIADTGPGMPAEKLAKVLRGGFTEGKKDGHGIGSKVVRETVEAHGGSIEGESEPGKGTTFIIHLPVLVQKSEEHFKLLIKEGETVLVVDDDASVREQWRLVLGDHGVKTVLCDSYENVEAQKIGSRITKTAVVDYHFENSERDGADIIRHLQSKGFQNLYLCTAEYWKPSVQRLAKELGARLCPKPLPKIEIAEAGGGIRALVIDDDEAIRMAWGLKKKSLGIEHLHTFASMEKCEESGLCYDTLDYAFVDKNIEQSCWDIARTLVHLKQKGVKKVIIASGESLETLKADPACAQADAFSREKIPGSLESLS